MSAKGAGAITTNVHCKGIKERRPPPLK